MGVAHYIIPDVPPLDPHIGEPFILVFPMGAPVSTIMYVRSVDRNGDTTTIGVRSRGERSVREAFQLDGDNNLIGAMEVSPDLVQVRRLFLNADVVIRNAAAVCYNKNGDGGQFRLRPGKHVHVDLLVRAAHAETWIPDNPGTSIGCAGECDDATGAFVESPLVLGFRVRPDDIDVVRSRPSGSLRMLTPYFDGKCVRGYLMLQGPDQLQNILTLS